MLKNVKVMGVFQSTQVPQVQKFDMEASTGKSISFDYTPPVTEIGKSLEDGDRYKDGTLRIKVSGMTDKVYEQRVSHKFGLNSAFIATWKGLEYGYVQATQSIVQKNDSYPAVYYTVTELNNLSFILQAVEFEEIHTNETYLLGTRPVTILWITLCGHPENRSEFSKFRGPIYAKEVQ